MYDYAPANRRAVRGTTAKEVKGRTSKRTLQSHKLRLSIFLYGTSVRRNGATSKRYCRVKNTIGYCKKVYG
jgi:hypothetical protein